MPLIRNGSVTEDLFTRIDEDGIVGDGITHALVPLKTWRDTRETFRDSNRQIGVLLSTADRVEDLMDDLAHLALIAIEMPAFKDGRIFSSARLLRERFGYEGEIRAVGDVLPDQALYLARCGVSEIQFKDDRRLGAFQNGLRELTVAMQPTRTATAPALRRRPVAGAVAQAAE